MKFKDKSKEFDLVFSENQDAIRASVQDFKKADLINAFQWLRGHARFPFPISIQLDLTNRCTARCKHCKQWTWPKRPEFSEKELRTIFEIFRRWDVKTLILSGGNPFLYEKVDLALSLAWKNQIAAGIISEGFEAQGSLIQSLCQHAAWIRFSLDGPDPEIHDHIRGRSGLFSRIAENIFEIKRHQKRPTIGLNCVIQKKNLSTLSKIIDTAEEFGVETLLFKMPHGFDESGQYLLSEEEYDKLLKWAEEQKEKKVLIKTNLNQLSSFLSTYVSRKDAAEGRPVGRFYSKNKIKCFAPMFSLTCDCEGYVYPCCYLHGDNRDWNSSKHNRMRNKYCLGNLLHEHRAVLDKLDELMRYHIRLLPANGYSECGSCTRHCQFNTSMTYIDDMLGSISSITAGIDNIYQQINSNHKKNVYL